MHIKYIEALKYCGERLCTKCYLALLRVVGCDWATIFQIQRGVFLERALTRHPKNINCELYPLLSTSDTVRIDRSGESETRDVVLLLNSIIESSGIIERKKGIHFANKEINYSFHHHCWLIGSIDF